MSEVLDCGCTHGTRCTFCGGRLRRDAHGHYCETRNCQGNINVGGLRCGEASAAKKAADAASKGAK